ncbi:hypothetical protein K440DRAFT_645605 [Wilcoxina mikolae CBS 423.85]|nr:hypothetical protein K440DRAFT_645605 [Wilcoxina mikolae CBS 423.85]
MSMSTGAPTNCYKPPECIYCSRNLPGYKKLVNNPLNIVHVVDDSDRRHLRCNFCDKIVLDRLAYKALSEDTKRSLRRPPSPPSNPPPPLPETPPPTADGSEVYMLDAFCNFCGSVMVDKETYAGLPSGAKKVFGGRVFSDFYTLPVSEEISLHPMLRILYIAIHASGGTDQKSMSSKQVGDPFETKMGHKLETSSSSFYSENRLPQSTSFQIVHVRTTLPAKKHQGNTGLGAGVAAVGKRPQVSVRAGSLVCKSPSRDINIRRDDSQIYTVAWTTGRDSPAPGIVDSATSPVLQKQMEPEKDNIPLTVPISITCTGSLQLCSPSAHPHNLVVWSGGPGGSETGVGTVETPWVMVRDPSKSPPFPLATPEFKNLATAGGGVD